MRAVSWRRRLEEAGRRAGKESSEVRTFHNGEDLIALSVGGGARRE